MTLQKNCSYVLTTIVLVFLCACSTSTTVNNPYSNHNVADKQHGKIALNVIPPLAQPSLAELYPKAAATLFSKRQLWATSMGVPESIVGLEISRQMEDYSPSTEATLRRDLVNIRKQIENFPSQGLSISDAENKQVMADILRYFEGHPNFDIGYINTWMGQSPFIINQIDGPIIDGLSNMQSGHQINNIQDAKHYLIRLKHFPELLKSVQKKYLADVAKAWIPPKDIQKALLANLTSTIQVAPNAHPLVTTFAEKLRLLENVDTESRLKLQKAAVEIVKNSIYPAYENLVFTVNSNMHLARDSAGIWAQPNGAAYYQYTISQLGDSALSAEQIHQIGLDEVSRISAQMDNILIAQSYTKGTVGERMVALSKDPQFLYDDSDEGRAKLLQDLNGLIQEATKKMATLFKTKPKYEVEVRAFPVDTQDSMPGGQYSQPPLDGSRPGIYWINLRDMQAVASFTLKTLTYHEANPGHHWQISLALGQESLPFMQRIAPYNSFIEGWALYSEQVAYEMGLYEHDPFGNLGRLQDEMFRAVRLVVDTGLHHKKWTRQQAIAYMMDKTGTPYSSSKAEIERYMVWPGQALGYKLGMLKILELREKAKDELGSQFDLAAFHDKILTGGAVPMKILEARIARWIHALKSQQVD